MTKLEFSNELATRLHSFSKEDIKKVLDYYCELIDDYIEDGLTVDEAIEKMGGINAITESITDDIPQNKSKRIARSLSKSAFVFLCVLLGIAAFSVGIVLIVLSVCTLALGLLSIVLIPTGIIFLFKGSIAAGLFCVGGALALTGLALALAVGIFLLFKYCRDFRRCLFKNRKERVKK